MENEIRTHNPEKSELNLEKLKNVNSLKIIDKEKKLYELLIEWDDTGTLPRMLKGIIRVLNDLENPMRFSQAANSIRGLADKLLNKGNIQIESQIILEEKELEDLKESFQNILEECLVKISDASDKTETKNQANRKFEELNNLLSSGAKTRTHRLLELHSSRKELKLLPLPLQEAAEELAKTYKYFTAVLHRHHKDEPEFHKKWLYFQDFLIHITSEFFDIAKEIDPFLEEETKTNDGLNKLAILISKPEYYEYFFKKLDKPELFDWLSDEIKAFDSIPKPQLTDDGQYLQFPPWLPGQYLIKVANKIPDKVFEVLKKVKTENSHALDDCGESIHKMPNDFLIKEYKEIIDLLDRWLDSKFTGLTHSTSIDLFRKYLDSGFFEGACRLLDILSKSKKEEIGGVKFRFKTYYYQKLVKELLQVLIENKPLMVLDIIEKRLMEAIENEIKDEASGDASIGWRSAIEDSPQNLGHDEVRNILLVVLRDTLYSLSLKEPKKAEETITRYLEERFSIFRRLAVHIIRVSNFDDLAEALLTDINNLDKSDIHHEFFKLMQDKFSVLNSNQKKQFIEWILEGHFKISIDNEKELERYRKNWQARRLWMLKEHIEKDDDLKEFRYLLDEYKDDFKGIVHPDFLSYHTSWHGPTSSLGKEEIAKMMPEEFVHWVKNNLQPPFEMMSPTPEGVSREFNESVRENPEIYALAAEIFLDEKIYPAYLCGLIRGLEEAIKSGKTFDIEPVIKFIENPLKFSQEPEVKTEHDEFDVGQYSWLRGSISNLIEALVTQDKICLSQDNMDITQNVLVELTEKDEDPTEDSEKQFGPDSDNMDYVGYCINSNRGKAMRALIRHALRREHMRPKEKEEGKDPFPPGERMDLYKVFFSKRLDEEPSPSVQSSYGEYLVQFFYLDQKWVEQMKKQDKLFPIDEERSKYWDAHWHGYIAFSNFFNRIYELLKEDYQKAVMKLTDKKERNHHDDRLAEHLMIAYWRNLEEIDKEGEILDVFFKNACPPLRAHAIWYWTNVIEEIKLTKDSEEWKILKALWQYRIAKVKDEEIANFVNWLKYCPEDLDDIVNLITPIIPYLHISYQEDDLLEYISEKIETNTINGLLLLNKLFEIRESFVNIRFRLALVRDILTKAGKYKDKPDIADSINHAINRLGEIGYYDFKDLLVGSHE